MNVVWNSGTAAGVTASPVMLVPAKTRPLMSAHVIQDLEEHQKQSNDLRVKHDMACMWLSKTTKNTMRISTTNDIPSAQLHSKR
ncbi:unnamed protein product [Heligmosomoides polygyrus]|uniref:Secreted protein n=1 Tax=Heligmosomoides polygyrus TaxID=6339 RepID=A0A183FK12_HELPZ|nr:unnamed protein product [Heligmosomoides polygyrus]